MRFGPAAVCHLYSKTFFLHLFCLPPPIFTYTNGVYLSERFCK